MVTLLAMASRVKPCLCTSTLTNTCEALTKTSVSPCMGRRSDPRANSTNFRDALLLPNRSNWKRYGPSWLLLPPMVAVIDNLIGDKNMIFPGYAGYITSESTMLLPWLTVITG